MNYAKRKMMAEELYARPPKDDMPNQKFKRGSIVKVTGAVFFLGEKAECEAVVEYTYAQKFWGDDVKKYCLIILNNEHGCPLNKAAWFDEDQLTLISADIKYGLKIIELYAECSK